MSPPNLRVAWLLGRSHAAADDRRAAAVLLTSRFEAGVPAADLAAGLADHGLVPLAYRHLVASGDAAIPAAFADEISREFRRHALTRVRYARRLRDLLDALEAAGVAAVPYKGPALAIQLFGNFAMRQFGDLDILVRPSQAGRAAQALLDAGLVRHRRAPDGWESYLHEVRHSSELRDPRLNVLVELHWSVADRFLGMDLDVDWLLSDTVRIDLLGRPTPVMHGERLLLALVLHGAKHLWERTIWLAEVGELMRPPTAINWAEVVTRADRSGIGRALRAALILVRDRLEIAPPPPWHRELDTDLGAARLAAMLGERLDGAAPDRLQARFQLG